MSTCIDMPSAGLLQDDDPYVRKTAAVCVAKLFDINPELVEDRGFLDTLKVSSLGHMHRLCLCAELLSQSCTCAE